MGRESKRQGRSGKYGKMAKHKMRMHGKSTKAIALRVRNAAVYHLNTCTRKNCRKCKNYVHRGFRSTE
jgi:hypothetical protein